MKISKFGPGVLILCIAVGLGAAALAPSCATVQKVATDVATSANNPDAAVGAIVADCAKPEIANQIANVLAGLNTIAMDPSKTVQVKNDEIDSLKAAGQEALICALRAGVTDLTNALTGAATVHASVDPHVLAARSLYAENVFSHGYKYVDGWDAGSALGMMKGAGGAGGSGSGGGGAGGAGK